MEIKLSAAEKIKIVNGYDVFSIMQKVLARENKIEQDKEHFWIVGINVRNKVLFVELVSLGGMRSTVVEPVNVFRVAVLKNAARVILVHNHPSGDILPSAEDQDITDRLIQVGRIIEVPVIDHLIISTEEYFSFENTGLHDQLQNSLKWVPRYEVVNRIKAEAEEIRKLAERKARAEGVMFGESLGLEKGLKKGIQQGRREGKKQGKQQGKQEGLVIGENRGIKKGIKEGKIEMARQLKQCGVDAKIIAKTSGLSLKVIEKL